MTDGRAAAPIGRILIVGAGLAGLALGVALRRTGSSPDIVERSDGWADPGAGIYLVGNAVRALGHLGAPDPAARGVVIRAQRFLNHRGEALFEVDVERYWQGCGRCVCVRRSELIGLLLETVGAPSVRLATTVRAIAGRSPGGSWLRVPSSPSGPRCWDGAGRS
jgi:FAD-dependent urate hydroxylase